ncbi:hypothetical protein YC2023_049954 [Brassica napus]
MVVGIYRRTNIRQNVPTNQFSSEYTDEQISVGIFRRPLSVGIYRRPKFVGIHRGIHYVGIVRGTFVGNSSESVYSDEFPTISAIRIPMFSCSDWSQSKRISTPWTGIIKHFISCSGSVMDGLLCNRWIVSNYLVREKKHLLTKIESQKKDIIRPRTKWKRASESTYPKNALGSIVLLLSLIFMAEKRFEYRYATEDELEEMKQREFTGWMFTYVCYIKYPRVRNRDDPWVTVTRLNPRGRVQGSSELEDPLQPSTSGNCSAAEDLAGVGLVVDLTDFGEEVVVHVEDEPVIGEFHQDPDSDSSGDDDSETDYH